ncbi:MULTISPECIES: hypothetical protein [Rhizobium/Agrobacterium group]|uniref:hypothetical protein n=1 Tax=Rhizobium/Agrobacterium group TaxID=227290 RepID=UPI00107FAF33|nr:MULTISPECIES: hypothetical protein [Rhizobium/Agrobacterium group]MBB4402519.1 hypothetical protein [Agrobacterium radiobacter]MBB5588673.1 hypothetical protein [Agrobacterium radiobacter]TGE89195.1 hypothetical protein C9418_12665 [Rhizobium sp. SEMIA 4032]
MPDSFGDRLLFLVIGAVATWLLQQYRIARNEDTVLINEHIKDIEKFRDAVQEFWLNLPEDQNGAEAAVAKVRAAHSATTFVYAQMLDICGELCDDYRKLSIELFDVSTGENFESPRNAIDPLRAIEAHDAAARLIHLLRKARKDVLSLSRLGKYGIDFKSDINSSQPISTGNEGK